MGISTLKYRTTYRRKCSAYSNRVPRVQITHSTEYAYHRPVRPLTHRLMLRPRDSHDLRLHSATLTVTPPPVRTRWAHDVFGNSLAYLEWGRLDTPLLRIVSSLELDHYPIASDLPLEPAAEIFPFGYSTDEAPDLARTIERQYPDTDRAVDAWARSFLNPSGPTRTLDMLAAMTRTIRAEFHYAARDAQGTNSPTHTLATRSGACRDYALLMMEAVRALGLAARFVSGYLYNDRLAGGRANVGGGATHAWVAVYLPGAGWVEYDPTNGLIAGRNLIRICTARTPEQATPVSGGYLGSKRDLLGLRVSVNVAVVPPA